MCKEHKGCLFVSAYKISNDIKTYSKKISDDITVTAVCNKQPITVRASIVCSVSNEPSNFYLNTSVNVLWLTPDMLSESFDIYSNVDWYIN